MRKEVGTTTQPGSGQPKSPATAASRLRASDRKRRRLPDAPNQRGALRGSALPNAALAGIAPNQHRPLASTGHGKSLKIVDPGDGEVHLRHGGGTAARFGELLRVVQFFRFQDNRGFVIVRHNLQPTLGAGLDLRVVAGLVSAIVETRLHWSGLRRFEPRSCRIAACMSWDRSRRRPATCRGRANCGRRIYSKLTATRRV